jgi:hypothetical protein
MSAFVPETVMSLLTSLGFDAGQPGPGSEIMIDTFDHWTNADSRFVWATGSGISMSLPAELAA